MNEIALSISRGLTYLPFWTLLRKEILRFMAVPLQTVLAPIVTATLFLFVFGVSMGSRISISEEFSYLQFVIPGLLLQAMITNSFQNTSSSLFFSRYIGNIVDLLVTPITPGQMILAYTLAAMVRSVTVGAAILIVSSFFTDLPWEYPLAAFGMAILTSFMLAQLGLIAAIYSESFEAISMYGNFLLLPLTYLGGMFYPVSILPEFWKNASQLNPLFYTIDGFRHAILGQGDISLTTAFAVTGVISLLLFIWTSILLGKGYRLRN